MKILVADDNADSRLLLTDLLLQWGHEAMGAEDGKAAWETLAGENAPQLAILDWVMPRIDGVELCRRLRKSDCPNPPYIILLTSKAGPQDVVMALEAGANDYMTKSCNFDELRARVQVGCRVLDLQTRLRGQERLQGVLQMAGAVCHEMNQPLQIVMTSAELLAAGLPPGGSQPRSRAHHSKRRPAAWRSDPAHDGAYPDSHPGISGRREPDY